MRRLRIGLPAATFAALIGLAAPVLGASFKLPDSDQRNCWNVDGTAISCTGSGQDGAYVINPLSYTANGNGTVTDNNTGLVWQQSDNGQEYTQSAGIAYCDALVLGGASDWRLPHIKELMSIFDYAILAPGPIFPAVFTNSVPHYYWASTPSSYSSVYGWASFVSWGNMGTPDKLTPFHVRCVRGAANNSPTLVDNHNGTVTDTRTGLAWQQSEAGTKAWDAALSYCEGLDLGGSTAWRLPNVKELQSLVDETKQHPTIDQTMFPGAVAGEYWTSTSYPYLPANVWRVNFDNGFVDGYLKTRTPLYTRCVRTAGAAPTITSVSPASGPAEGGTPVTITGTNLTDATSVSFGGTAATAVTVVGPTSVTCTTPPHAAGVVNVALTTPSGTATRTGAYSFLPSITEVSPSSGPVGGGTAVLITGTDLTGATSVSFGGAAATALTVINSTTVICTTPAHAAGAVDVAVTTAAGTVTKTAGYSYAGVPAITAATPSSGPIAGGTAVLISGARLTGATSVSFDGVAAPSMTVINPSTVICTTPAHAEGAVDIAVTTAAGTATKAGGYTFVAPPTLTEVSPTSGPSAGGATVTLTGTRLTGATAVSFGGTAATAVTVLGPTSVTCTTPAHAAGTVDVALTTPGGSTSLAGSYTYVAPPTITTVDPVTGTIAGGTAVTITGTNLTGTTSVSFGGTAATAFTVVGPTSVTCTAPAHAAGAVDVALTTPGGTATRTGGYRYNSPPTDIALSSAIVESGRPSGTVVGTLGTTDADAGDTFTYALVSGTGSTDNASFQIVANTTTTPTTYQLRTNAILDFAAQPSYSVRVRSTDAGGLWIEKALTITAPSYVLWTRSDTGRAVLWKIDPGAAAGDPLVIPLGDGNSASLYSTGGVGAQWTATSFKYVNATTAYVLWTRSDTGRAVLWKIDPSAAAGNPLVIPVGTSANLYSTGGIGPQWAATSFEYVNATTAYVLWTRSDTGRAVLWKINPGAASGTPAVIPLAAGDAANLRSTSGVGGPWQATGFAAGASRR